MNNSDLKNIIAFVVGELSEIADSTSYPCDTLSPIQGKYVGKQLLIVNGSQEWGPYALAFICEDDEVWVHFSGQPIKYSLTLPRPG